MLTVLAPLIAMLPHMVFSARLQPKRTNSTEINVPAEWIVMEGLPAVQGEDAGIDTVGVKTVDDMMQVCSADAQCVGFAYRPSRGNFYPKKVGTGFDPSTATYKHSYFSPRYQWYYVRNRAELQIPIPAVLNIKKVSQYTADDMLDASVEETLLLLLHRDIQRLKRLKEIDPQGFHEKFPKDYSWRHLKRKLMLNALSVGLTLIGVADKMMEVSKVFEYSRIMVSNTIRYSKFGKWLADYATSMHANTETLVTYGGKAPTRYWADVSYGELFESYRRVSLAENTLSSATPITLRNSSLRSRTCNESGPVLKFVSPGTLVRSLGDRASSECIRIQLLNGEGTEGWLNRSDVADFGWYQFVGSATNPKTLPIFLEPGGAQTGEQLEVGEAFTVIEKLAANNSLWPTFWRLGDGRGYLGMNPNVRSALRGPLVPNASPKEAEQLLESATASKTDAGSNMQRAASATKDAYDSAPSVIGRLAMKTFFFVGGFFTSGYLWLPSLVFGLTDSAVGASLAGATAWTSVEKVTFILAALWRFEHRFFTGGSKHQQTCNVSKGQLPVCEDGEVCLRSSALESAYFGRMQHETGYCIRPPWPVLHNGSFCLVDGDCQSSYCKYKPYDESGKKESIVEAMGGTCQGFGT